MFQELIVNDEPISEAEYHRYVLRWSWHPGDIAEPHLYLDGRRIILPWKFNLMIESKGGGDSSA